MIGALAYKKLKPQKVEAVKADPDADYNSDDEDEEENSEEDDEELEPFDEYDDGGDEFGEDEYPGDDEPV